MSVSQVFCTMLTQVLTITKFSCKLVNFTQYFVKKIHVLTQVFYTIYWDNRLVCQKNLNHGLYSLTVTK